MVSTITPSSSSQEETTRSETPAMSAEELQQMYEAPPAEKPAQEKSRLATLGASFRDRIIGALPSPREKYASLKKVFKEKVLSIPGLQRVLDFFAARKEAQQSTLPSSEDQVDKASTPAPDQEEPSAEEVVGKSEESVKAYLEAEKASKAHMDAIAENFADLHHNYRRQLMHEHPDVKMNSPVLEISRTGENNLMDLAAEIAEKQARQGFVAHTTEEYRNERNISGEIITSKFSTAREALQSFLKSKKNHYHYVTGNFGQMGYAIRGGIEHKTGKKVYYLVVLYRNGQAQETKPPVIEIPGNEEQPQTLTGESLEECIADRRHLGLFFKALDTELKNKGGLGYEINQSETQKLQEHPSLKGVFCITMKRGDKTQLYQVFSTPPVLKRVEIINGKQRVSEIPFHQLIDDFEARQEAPSDAEALEDQLALPGYDPSSSAEELQEQYEQPAHVPEHEREKKDDGELATQADSQQPSP